MKYTLYLFVLSMALTQSLVSLAFPAQDELRGLHCQFLSSKDTVSFTLVPLQKDQISSNQAVVYQVSLSRSLYLGEETSRTFIVSATKDTPTRNIYTLSGEAGVYTSFEFTLGKETVLRSSNLSSMFFATLVIVFDDGSDDAKRTDKNPVCQAI